MKSNQLLKLALVTLALAVAGFTPPTARAQSAIFQQNENGQSLGVDTCGTQHFASNTNLWTRSEVHALDCNNNSYLADVSNWNLSTYPNGATFNVTIPTTSRAADLPQGAHLNESVAVGNLTINSGALLTYDANNSAGGGAHSVNLTLNGGTLTNNGTLKSIGPTEAGQTYTFAVNTLLTGSGTSNFGYGTVLTGPGTLTIGSAQNVIGGGNVTVQLPLINQGVITADGSSGFFGHNLITFMDSQITNTGTIQTTAGGAIQLLANVAINNTGGTLRASSSDRFNIFSGATINGGTLVSTSTDLTRDELFYMTTATLNGVAIATGTKIRVDGGILTLNGAIANNGQINFANTQNQAGTGRFNVASDTTFSGTGLTIINGSPNTIAPGKTLTLGTGQTFSVGFVQISGAISNHGLINAGSDRGLFLYGGNYQNSGIMQSSGMGQLIFGQVGTGTQNTFTIDNTGGTIQAIDTSSVHFNGDILVRNGALSASSNSALSDDSRVTLENVTVSGLFHIKRACFGTVTLQLSGSLTNNGQIDDLAGECNPININLLGNVSFAGNGSFVLYRGATITSTNGGVLTNGASHTLNGNFTITSNLINNGTAVVGGDNTMNLSGPSATNNGTLWVASGAVIQQSANSTLTNYDPPSQTLNSGTYLAVADPQASARLSLNIGPVVINKATITLSGPGAQFDPINSIHQNWGTLSLLNGKILAIAPAAAQSSRLSQSDVTAAVSFANAGTLKLDEKSAINVNGNYSQGSNAILYIEIGSDGPSPNFHQLTVNGTAALAGTLNVKLVNGYTPAADKVFSIIGATGITGGFTKVHGADITYTSTGVTIHPNGTAIPAPVPNRLLNISTRMRVQADPNQLIGGFIITGTQPKKVIILATGPSLSAFGIPGVLADPTLQLFQGNTLIASNDNWKIPAQAEIEATQLQPTNNLESALVRTLDPGAYTAIVRGTNNGTGVGVIQVFDLGSAADSKLANISSRGFVEANDANIMIAGLILGGDEVALARVALRAIGPSLSAFLSGALQDPTLELKDANGVTLMSNDNWKLDGQQAEIEALGLAPSDDREAALVTTLPNASYTAIVRGKNNTTGVALVEVYNVQ